MYESVGDGAFQAFTLYAEDEANTVIDSILYGESLNKAFEIRRHIRDQRRRGNPGSYAFGEFLGTVPTLLVPGGLGSSAARAAAAQGMSRTVQVGRGLIAAVETGIPMVAAEGFFQSDGSLNERLRAAGGAVVIGGVFYVGFRFIRLLTRGLAYIVTRGPSRTRIPARIQQVTEETQEHLSDRQRQASRSEPDAARGGRANAPSTNPGEVRIGRVTEDDDLRDYLTRELGSGATSIDQAAPRRRHGLYERYIRNVLHPNRGAPVRRPSPTGARRYRNADHALSREFPEEAKYTSNWSTSPYNPAAPRTSRQRDAIDHMLSQAEDYSLSSKEVIYYSNSMELIEYWSRDFSSRGWNNISWVHAPSRL